MTKDIAMNMIPRTLLATAVALSLAIPGLASADRRGNDRYSDHGDRHVYRHDYKHGHRKHHRDRQHDRHSYRPGRHANRYYAYKDDDDDDLLIGLLVGGILGYALNGAQQHSSGYNYYGR
jgi:hypothetical protein